MREALTILLNNNYIKFGSELHRQTIGIPMGTNCAPLAADLFFCYERDFMLALLQDTLFEVIESFNDISRYLDDLLTMTSKQSYNAFITSIK